MVDPTSAGVRSLLAAGGELLLEVPNAGSLRARLSHRLLSRWVGIGERHRAYSIHLGGDRAPSTPRMGIPRSGISL